MPDKSENSYPTPAEYNYWQKIWNKPAHISTNIKGITRVARVNSAFDIVAIISLAVKDVACRQALDNDHLYGVGLTDHNVTNPDTIAALIKYHPEETWDAFDKLSILLKKDEFALDFKFHLFAFMTRCLRQNPNFGAISSKTCTTFLDLADYAKKLDIEKTSRNKMTSQKTDIKNGKEQFYFAHFHLEMFNRAFNAIDTEQHQTWRHSLLDCCALAALRYLEIFPKTRFNSKFPHHVIEHCASGDQIRQNQSLIENSYEAYISARFKELYLQVKHPETMTDAWRRQTDLMIDLLGEDNRAIIDKAPLPAEADLLITMPRITPGGEKIPALDNSRLPATIAQYRYSSLESIQPI